MEDRYFIYLTSLIGGAGKYEKLLRRLFDKEYYWVIGNDENRAVCGESLRREFCIENDIPLESHALDFLGPCRVLEMLVGFAMSIENDIMWDENQCNRVAEWFWEMIFNLRLAAYNDYVYRADTDEDVNHILDDFLERRYEYDGYGGLFPIENPKCDQRKVELWYQAQTYFIEKDKRIST